MKERTRRMKDYTKHINKNADIFCSNGFVIVTDGKKEIFRAEKNKQTITLAHAIYMGTKYGDCQEERI